VFRRDYCAHVVDEFVLGDGFRVQSIAENDAESAVLVCAGVVVDEDAKLEIETREEHAGVCWVSGNVVCLGMVCESRVCDRSKR